MSAAGNVRPGQLVPRSADHSAALAKALLARAQWPSKHLGAFGGGAKEAFEFDWVATKPLNNKSVPDAKPLGVLGSARGRPA